MQLAQKKVAMNIVLEWTVTIVNTINLDLNASQILEYSVVAMKDEHVTSTWRSAWIISPDTTHTEMA